MTLGFCAALVDGNVCGEGFDSSRTCEAVRALGRKKVAGAVPDFFSCRAQHHHASPFPPLFQRGPVELRQDSTGVRFKNPRILPSIPLYSLLAMSAQGQLKRASEQDTTDSHAPKHPCAESSRAGASSSSHSQLHHHFDMQAIAAELTCNICLDLPTRVASVLPCLHNFCWGCIQEWFKAHSKCPRCCSEATDARPNAVLTNVVHILAKSDPSLAKPAESVLAGPSVGSPLD